MDFEGESVDERAGRAQRILDTLEEAHPDWAISLDFDGPFQLLVATILSAQCTDEMVNRVTPALFEAYPDAASMAKADQDNVEALVHSCGFYSQKARNIIGAARRIVAAYDGEVPGTMEELVTLPGVGRKTANVVLHNWFDRAEGVCVDTHVKRISKRLGLTEHGSPTKVERDLMALLPENDWHRVTHLMIDHGRATCTARNPDCDGCVVRDLCPSAFEPDRFF